MERLKQLGAGRAGRDERKKGLFSVCFDFSLCSVLRLIPAGDGLGEEINTHIQGGREKWSDFSSPGRGGGWV